MVQLVIKWKEQVTTTSILVAEKFKKEHKDVLRAIRELNCSDDFSQRNFTPSVYNIRGKDYPMFIMTRDAFTALVMSFTGAAAAKFREEFIAEFNRMEEQLKKEQEPPKLIPVYSKRIMNEEARNCPDTHFCIFVESHPVMIAVETNVGSQCQFDLIDGSIGIRWAKFREGKHWAGESSTYEYVFTDKRGSVNARCYLNSELQYFKKWLRDVYKMQHLIPYLTNKYSNNNFMLKKVEAFKPKLLKAS